MNIKNKKLAQDVKSKISPVSPFQEKKSTPALPLLLAKRKNLSKSKRSTPVCIRNYLKD